jgi:predicted N-acyltransferase
MISIERFDSIVDIDRPEWDRLAGDNVLASWGWLRTMEETSLYPQNMTYLVARNKDRYMAAVPCYFQSMQSQYNDIDSDVFGGLATYARWLGISLLPALVCGPSRGPVEHILIPKNGPQKERRVLLLQMLEAMEAITSPEGLMLCFRNVVENNGGGMAGMLYRRGYLRVLQLPMTCLKIAWTSFPEYVGYIKSRSARAAHNIRQECDRAAQAGITFREIPDPSVLQDQLHGLLDRHYLRLNKRPFPYKPHFLATLKRNLGERAVLFLAIKDHDPLAIGVSVCNSEAIYLLMVGVDDKTGHESFVYFNNSYYQSIRYAINKGLRRIYEIGRAHV